MSVPYLAAAVGYEALGGAHGLAWWASHGVGLWGLYEVGRTVSQKRKYDWKTNHLISKKSKNHNSNMGKPNHNRGAKIRHHKKDLQNQFDEAADDDNNSQLNTMSGSTNQVTPSKENKDSAKLAKPAKTVKTKHQRIDGDATTNFRLGFKAVGRFSSLSQPTRSLVDTIFPVTTIDTTSFGTCLTGQATANTLTGPLMAETDSATISYGLSRSVQCSAGAQKVFQFCHLSGGNAAIGAYKIPNGAVNNCIATGYTFSGLVANARDGHNLGLRDNSVGTFTNSNNKQGYANTIEYKGGWTEHIFVSTTTSEITMIFNTARPKSFLGYKYDPISLTVLSKINDVPWLNTTGTSLLQPNGIVCARENPQFTFGKRDDLLLYNYELSEPEKVVLPPGGRVSVRVYHPSFYFKDTPFNQGLINGSQNGAGNDDVCYYPFCTVFLLGRMYGQLSADSAISEGPVTAVNTVDCQVGHTQREHHAVRATMLSQAGPRIFIDQTNDTTADFIVNTEANDTTQSRI